jgi:hypothetical protein
MKKLFLAALVLLCAGCTVNAENSAVTYTATVIENSEEGAVLELDETEEPKQSRNSKRKLITGEEKFHSNKRVVTTAPENEPIVKFCSSCGNIVKKDDVVCSQCGDPIE